VIRTAAGEELENEDIQHNDVRCEMMRYEMMISHDLLLPVGMCTLHVPVVLGLPKVPGYFKILFTGMTHSTQRAMVCVIKASKKLEKSKM
jgi:hypothetical protein